jgi:hypothetical protein
MKIMTTTFNSRETYLAYRADWKASYNDLSQEIRGLKRICKKGGDTASEQSRLHYLSKEATAKLEELKEAKLEAGRQWAASREARVAA